MNYEIILDFNQYVKGKFLSKYNQKKIEISNCLCTCIHYRQQRKQTTKNKYAL